MAEQHTSQQAIPALPAAGNMDLLQENDRLRRELEELKKLQGQQAPARPLQQLQRRGSGPIFSIRSWKEERNESKNRAGSNPVAQADDAVKSADVGKEHEAGDAEARLPRLDSSCEVDRLLSEALHCFERSSGDGADLFNQAFAAYLRERGRPHVSFSSRMPLFFAKLGGGCCRDLLRGLKASARFGDTPPRARPKDVDRWEFVRELCAQAGISLDLVRLSFLQRKIGRRHRSQQVTAVKDADGGKPTESAPEQSFHQEDVQRLLTRAGKYLREMQRDMEFLRDHADKLAKEVQSRRALQKAQRSAASSAPAVTSVADVPDVLPEDMDEADHVEALLKMTENAAAAAATAVPEASTEDNPAEGREPATRTLDDLELPPGIDQAGLVDELIIPTFGQFLEKQLLPLYVRDIPFDTLQHLADHYCGVSLDSDDEREAIKAAGGLSPSQKAKTKGPTRRNLTRSLTNESMDGEASPAQPSSQSPPQLRRALRDLTQKKESLGELIQAAASKKPMRAQMVSSVVEKRKLGKPAPADVIAPPPRKPAPSKQASMGPPATAEKRPSGKRSHVASTPQVSKALLMSPKTSSAAKKPRLMLSPVQWRGSSAAPRPAPSPVVPAASVNFDAFEDDTPWKIKKSGSGFDLE